jgi:putative heme degradation protein
MSEKEERLLRYLTEFGSITSFEAFKELGDTRLSATIFNLRKQGNSITDTWENCINRYGKKVRYKKYILLSDDSEN